MLRAPRQQVKRVRKQVQDRLERRRSSRRTARQIQDQRVARGSADGAAQRSEGCLLEAGGAHTFRDAVHEAFAYDARGFGRDIARSQTGTASGDHQVHARCMTAKRGDDPVQVIGDRLYNGVGDASRSQPIGYRGARKISLAAVEAAIADRENGGAGRLGKAQVHERSLRCWNLPRAREYRTRETG